MSFGGKHHASRNEDFQLRRASAQLFARGFAHLVNAIGNYRHDRKWTGLTAWIHDLVGGEKIRATAGLSQGASRVEQSRADDFALGKQARDPVIGAAGFSDRGETVHQAAAQVVG